MFWVDASFLLSKWMEAPILPKWKDNLFWPFYFNSNSQNGKVCVSKVAICEATFKW